MNKKLLELFNKQINLEFYTGYLYYAMSTYFDRIMMKSFSLQMKHMASFELELAQKMYDYLILRNEKLIFQKIKEPKADWHDVSNVFSDILVHEEMLFCEVQNLHEIAKDMADIAMSEFLSDILNKKTISLKNARKIASGIESSQNLAGII